MHGNQGSVEAGGLMSYAPYFPDLWRRAADYVDKILRGAKPGEIPVEQPTKFELVFNLETAKAIGLDRAAQVAIHRRRGDRVVGLMSAIGTLRTCQRVRSAVVIGG